MFAVKTCESVLNRLTCTANINVINCLGAGIRAKQGSHAKLRSSEYWRGRWGNQMLYQSEYPILSAVTLQRSEEL